MANQNTIADLSTTPASNLNFKGQSIQGTAVANTIDTMFKNEASMLKAFYDSLGGVATVSGTDTYTVTITEDWAALASGLVLAIKPANANTGAATLNVTVPTAGALGAKAIRLQGDSALSGGEMVANGDYLLRYSTSYNSSAGAWILLNPSNGGSVGREKLAAARTYYVRTDGSDSNNGLANTSGGAFLTIQKAIDKTAALDLAGNAVTIQVAAGTYTGAISVQRSFLGGSVSVNGDTGTPSNCALSFSNFGDFTLSGFGTALSISGFKITNSAASSLGQGVLVKNGAVLTLGGNMEFGTCTRFHIEANTNATVNIGAGYTVSGNASRHWSADYAAIVLSTQTITMSGTPAFATAFCYATNGAGVTVFSLTKSGSATGKYYDVSLNAVVNTFGGGSTYLFGGTAGTTATGGQYA